jgi:hypothetical protein
VSPSEHSSFETLSTLKFVSRAKFIKNLAVLNEKSLDCITDLQNEIKILKTELLKANSALALIPQTVPRSSPVNRLIICDHCSGINDQNDTVNSEVRISKSFLFCSFECFDRLHLLYRSYHMKKRKEK